MKDYVAQCQGICSQLSKQHHRSKAEGHGTENRGDVEGDKGHLYSLFALGEIKLDGWKTGWVKLLQCTDVQGRKWTRVHYGHVEVVCIYLKNYCL